MIPYSKQLIENDDIEAVVEILKSAYLTGGATIQDFESQLCNYTQTKYRNNFV